MSVAVAAPVAIGLAAEAGGGVGGDGGGTPLEVAGNEVPAPVEADGKGPPPVEGVPVAVTTGGEEKEKEKKEKEKEKKEKGDGVKWLVHYSSAQDILLVGDGDFSFSLALATAFGSGANLVATSLDTYEALRGKYSKAESNITELKRLGATVLHGVDAKKMMRHPDLKNRRFDRIIFNFPHAGFKGKEDDMHMIKELVWGFFLNAVHLLCPYCEIHISHKTGGAHDRWGLEDLAYEALLVLVEKVAFRREDYPGYNQKRGDSARCDEAFDLGACFAFKFRIRDLKNWKKLNGNMIRSMSLLGIMAPATGRGPFQLFPLDEAWPRRQHLLPPADAVHMTLEPYGVAQRRHPDFPLNFDGTVRDLYFHHQGNTRPMLRTPGPLMNTLHHLGGVIPPPMGIIPCPDVLAPHEESWYQHRPTADAPGRDHSCLAWEHLQGSQRDYGMQGQVMPAATSVSHSALLEHRRRDRELVQKERLRMMVELYGKVCGERSLCRAPE